jgi:hypothetical protein
MPKAYYRTGKGQAQAYIERNALDTWLSVGDIELATGIAATSIRAAIGDLEANKNADTKKDGGRLYVMMRPAYIEEQRRRQALRDQNRKVSFTRAELKTFAIQAMNTTPGDFSSTGIEDAAEDLVSRRFAQ